MRSVSRIRILFLGTPEFAVHSLEKLIEDPHFEIVAVVTQPDRPAGRNMKLMKSPVKILAESRGLLVFSPETVNTEEFRNEILKLKVESAAVIAFGQILGQKFLDLFPLGCVNVHGSILPRWRGAAPIQRAIMADDEESGVSLQLIVKKLDAGDILAIRKIALKDDINALILHDQLKLLSAQLLQVEYMDYLRGNILGHAQDESLVTIAPKIDKAEARIDWRRSAREIFCQVRGLAMGPAAFTQRDSKNLKIHRAQLHTSPHQAQLGQVAGQILGQMPGEIIDVGQQSFRVACGTGSLEVLELQPESKPRMKTSDYLRGYPLAIGQIFN
jgi:methionyl-tRNA formyltransferase